jgi:hypothetical protein
MDGGIFVEIRILVVTGTEVEPMVAMVVVMAVAVVEPGKVVVVSGGIWIVSSGGMNEIVGSTPIA